MAATFTWERSHGAGQSVTTASDINWKNIDDNTTAYTSAPITAGNNSFDMWLAGHFSGSFNQIFAGLWAHTAGSFGTGLTLKGAPTGASQLTYTTPSTNANTNLTVDMTATTNISSGTVVYFGPTNANTAGKASSTTSNPAWTNYLTTQLQTTAAAGAGDTATATVTLQYNEN